MLHYLRAHYSAHTAQGGRARANKEEHRSRERAIKQWMFVDELASGMNDSDPGVGARPLSERRERGIAGESNRRRGGVRQGTLDVESFHTVISLLLASTLVAPHSQLITIHAYSCLFA